MSWDNEDASGKVDGDDAVLMQSWDDEPIMDSWDAELPEEPQSTSSATNAASNIKKNKAKGKVKGKNMNGKDQVLLEIDTLDPEDAKEIIKGAQLDADLKHASDLFTGLSTLDENPRARALRDEQEQAQTSIFNKRATFTKDTPIENHPLFKAETKSEYQDLRKALSTAIVTMNEKSTLNYASSLAIDLVRDVCKPMPIESIRQTIATLTILMKEKEKEERMARLARVKGGTATGGAGKKKAKGKTNLGGAFKKENDFELNEETFDDFDDDDFM